jgi:hypothetical protein
MHYLDRFGLKSKCPLCVQPAHWAIPNFEANEGKPPEQRGLCGMCASVKCRLADAKSNDRRQTWDVRWIDGLAKDAYQTIKAHYRTAECGD